MGDNCYDISRHSEYVKELVALCKKATRHLVGKRDEYIETLCQGFYSGEDTFLSVLTGKCIFLAAVNLICDSTKHLVEDGLDLASDAVLKHAWDLRVLYDVRLKWFFFGYVDFVAYSRKVVSRYKLAEVLLNPQTPIHRHFGADGVPPPMRNFYRFIVDKPDMFVKFMVEVKRVRWKGKAYSLILGPTDEFSLRVANDNSGINAILSVNHNRLMPNKCLQAANQKSIDLCCVTPEMISCHVYIRKTYLEALLNETADAQSKKVENMKLEYLSTSCDVTRIFNFTF